MDTVVLCFETRPLREFPLNGVSLEVGGASSCDIVVHDPGIDDHHLLVRQEHGTVVTYDLRSDAKLRKPLHLPLGGSVPLGRHHSLVRLSQSAFGRPCGERSTEERQTEPIHDEHSIAGEWKLAVGRGGGARIVALGRGPTRIGSDPRNDVPLVDRSVSARHCRIDVDAQRVTIRDLGSRNGTYVQGVRVVSAELSIGMTVRVGRTDLVLFETSGIPPQHAAQVALTPGMVPVFAEVRRLAPLPWPVLIRGETGAGKEVVARELHLRSSRAKRPFVAINAGGLPREIVESELFGHERGAFTGAVGLRKGVFEQADGGTLFLDEVGELPLDLQARLLRVLETNEVRRVGAETPVRIDSRVVCATHRDLRQMAGDGRFREDLYYRLARLVVEVPPLRERPDDIEPLADHFLQEISGAVGPRHLTVTARARLVSYRWPGNARELRNVLSAAAADCASSAIDGSDIERATSRLTGPDRSRSTVQALDEIVRQHRGNLSAAARALGIPRSTLRDRLRSRDEGVTV